MSGAKSSTGKAKNAKFAFRAFSKSVKPYLWWIILSVALSVGSAIAGLFTPKLLGEMIDTATNTATVIDGVVDWSTINWNIIGEKAILAIILFILASILNYAQAYILAVVTAKYTKGLREKIIEKIGKLPISYFDKHKFGDTISRMTNDIDVLSTSMSQEIADISLSLTTLIGVTVLMLTISIPLSLISFVIVPLSVFVVGKIAAFAQKYFREQQNTLGELNSKIEEDYSGQVVIKSNSYEDDAKNSFDKTNRKLAKAAWKAQVYSSLSMPVTHIFTNLGYVATCIVGGYLVIDGQITIGNIQAFVQYVSRFNRPITEIASSVSTIQSLLAASERIFEFLDEPEEMPDPIDAKNIANIKGSVEFHNVNFSYDKKNPIIKNFSAKIEPGQQIAIVGPTGAGKTTIINLLMRFYDLDSGYIAIDGTRTDEMKRSDVRKLFGMVLQDTWLFSGSITENLKYGNQSATLDEIKKATEASDIHHVIESLSNNYETIINEDSDNISAGEKQLLTIARVMIANPPMIILDEATSNVDTRTEQLVQAAFEKLTKGRTSFVIAHRLSTIRNADLIIVMRDGNIVEQGNHNELLKQNGFYAELYNSQFAED